MSLARLLFLSINLHLFVHIILVSVVYLFLLRFLNASFLSVRFFSSLVHLNLFNNIIMGVRVCWARCYIPMHWGMRANKWPVDHSLLCYNNMYTLCIELLHSTLVVYSLNSYSVWIEWRRMKCKKKQSIGVCAEERHSRVTYSGYSCAQHSDI